MYIHLSLSLSIYIYIYMYIHIERERERQRFGAKPVPVCALCSTKAEVIRKLGVVSVRLFTNNPDKLKACTQSPGSDSASTIGLNASSRSAVTCS